MSQAPKIAISPRSDGRFEEAVRDGGGEVVKKPAEASGLIWTDPRAPKALGKILKRTSIRWVQLPFAGIESFFAAGVIAADRTWTCAKGIYGPATAEHALALLLAAARRLNEHVRAEMWRPAGFGSPERRIAGATVLIVGAGWDRSISHLDAGAAGCARGRGQ